MSKTSSKWACQECGYITHGYLGKCPECNSFGTLIEEISYKKGAHSNVPQRENKFYSSCDINIENIKRTKTFHKELDNVLGGGFVKGSLLLLAGEPGIGKSTILLQIAANLPNAAYVSSEESIHQIKLRLERLNLKNKDLLLLAENNLEIIFNLIEKEKPEFLVIDSIQAIYSEELEGAAGNVSQVRECAGKLLRLAKDKNITTILVGHVNKEGQIAGPKVLEHIVDTVLYFEGERFNNFRILRTIKNRFGETTEIAVFEMKQDGLSLVPNPSFLFMSQNKEPVPGCAYAAIQEGSKTIIAEVQALVGNTIYTSPRRVANGVDLNRILQIVAILERRVGLNFSKHDLFVNLVGGLTSYEPALDLPIAMAIVSCKQDVVPTKKTVYIGEIGLAGEIRQVNQAENRIKECMKLGFEQVVIPTCKISPGLEINIIQVNKILDAIRNSLTAKNVTQLS